MNLDKGLPSLRDETLGLDSLNMDKSFKLSSLRKGYSWLDSLNLDKILGSLKEGDS